MTNEEAERLVVESLQALCLRASPELTAVSVCEVIQRDKIDGTPNCPVECPLAVWIREATQLPNVIVTEQSVLVRNGSRKKKMLVIPMPEVVRQAVLLLDKSKFIIRNGRKKC